MFVNARRWGLLAGGFAAGVACVVGLAGTTASAEPTLPQPALPAPATVTQTITVAGGHRAAHRTRPRAHPGGVRPAAAAAQAAAPGVQPAAGLSAATRRRAAAVAAPSTIVPAASGTIIDFFKSKNVGLEPQIAPRTSRRSTSCSRCRPAGARYPTPTCPTPSR